MGAEILDRMSRGATTVAGLVDRSSDPGEASLGSDSRILMSRNRELIKLGDGEESAGTDVGEGWAFVVDYCRWDWGGVQELLESPAV